MRGHRHTIPTKPKRFMNLYLLGGRMVGKSTAIGTTISASMFADSIRAAQEADRLLSIRKMQQS